MAKNIHWQDEYWLLLMQLYLKKPEGVKPLYSKGIVNLSMELHIPPQSSFMNGCMNCAVWTHPEWKNFGNAMAAIPSVWPRV